MRRVSIRLYWMGVTGNVLALVILLRGFFIPMQTQEKALAVLLTGVSAICWLLYFLKSYG